MLLRSSTYITPSLPPPTIRFVFGMSSAFWMPRSASVAFRNDQLKGVNQSSERARRTDLDEAVPEVSSADVAVERSVARQRIQVAGRIGRQSSARLPDSAEAAVRRGVVDHDLLQARGVVAQDPAVIRTLIAVRGPRDVDGAVIEEQARALIVRSRVERDVVLRVAPVARAGDAGLDEQRAAGPLAAVAHIDRVQPLDERAALLRPRDEVHRLRQRVDDRRSADPDVAGEVDVGAAGLADVGAGHGDDAGRGVRVVDAPQRRRGRRIVGVERVDAVVVCGDVHDIADAETGNVDALDVQRLRVDLVVNSALEELAELADVDVRRREDDVSARLAPVRAASLC